MVVKLSTLRVSAEMDASKYVAGMNAKVAADKQGAASSAQVGAAIAATDTKISSASSGVERLSRSYIAGYASEAKFEAALRTLARALDTGNVSADRAQQILVGLHARYGMMANASDVAARGQHQLAAAVAAANSGLDAQTGAMMRANTAASGMRHNTAGIAAQFQDIGVTAAMGMNPLMIALQQGTQLTGQLAVMDKPLQTLGKSLLSLISPLSVITIGLVALAAAGLQMVDWGSTAEAVLNGLADVLVPIAPYAAAAAAGLALLYSPAIIMGIVNVVAALASLAAQVITTAAVMVAANPVGALILGFAAAATAAIIFRDDLARILGRDIVADAQKAINWIIGSFVGGFNGIKATWSMLPAAIGDLVTQAANNTIAGVESMINFVGRMVNDFIKSINSAIMMVPEQFRAGWTGLGEIGQVNFGRIENPNEGKAGDVADQIGAAMAAAQAYDYVGTAAAFVQGAASGAADALRGLADAAGASGEESGKAAKEAAKLAKAYDDIVAGAHKFIQEQENERAALGQTEEQANALRYTFELLNKAKEAGIDLTAPQIAELSNLGREMAAAEAETDRLTKAFEDQKKVVDDVLGTIGDAFSGLFDGTIKDFDGFIDHMLGGFAKLGQANIDKLFTSDGLGKLFETTTGEDGKETNFFDALFKATRQGTREGSADGTAFGISQLGGYASAAIGGLGLGYEAQDPVMGGLGGAAQGAMAGAAGGPVGMAIGAVIGGIAGFIGGIMGANRALEEAKQKLDENRLAIEQFIAAANGEQISAYAKTLADFNKQALELIELAEKAGDQALVAQLRAANDNVKGTLGNQFLDDLEASINRLEGNDFLNQIVAAQERYNLRLKDAELLGVSADGALTELNLTLKKIATEGDLTTEQMAQFAAMFPEIAAAINTVDIAALEANVDRARSALSAAYQKERAALEAVVNTWKQLSAQLRDFRNGLRLNDAVSPLSPLDKFSEAQRQFNEVSAKALAGDQQAMGDLTNVSQEYLDAARGYYASSEQYFSIFESVEAILDQALGKADTQVSAAEQQIALLDRQVAGLIDINESVLSVAEAIRQLKLAQGELAGANGFDASTYWSQDLKSLYAQTKDYKADTGASSIPIAGFWNELFSATSAGMMDEIARKLAAQVAALPRYADGTMFHPGGPAWVGERGPELLNLPRGAQVMPNSMSMAFAANGNGSNDNRALIAEIRALRDEVTSLKSVAALGAQATVEAVAEVKSEISTGNREGELRGSRKVA